jgi:hypothetical protein
MSAADDVMPSEWHDWHDFYMLLWTASAELVANIIKDLTCDFSCAVCRVCCKIFPNNFNGCHGASVAPRNIVATYDGEDARRPTQALLTEALNDLFTEYGKPPIA